MIQMLEINIKMHELQYLCVIHNAESFIATRKSIIWTTMTILYFHNIQEQSKALIRTHSSITNCVFSTVIELDHHKIHFFQMDLAFTNMIVKQTNIKQK